MKTIRAKILVCCIVSISLSIIILGICSTISSYNATLNVVKDSMNAAVNIAADRTYWEIKSYTNIARELGTTPQFSDSSSTDNDLQVILQETNYQHSLYTSTFVRSDGEAIDGNNYAERDYFKLAMQGKIVVSEPIVSKVTGEQMIVIAAPVWANGEYDTDVVGAVLIVPDTEFLNNIMGTIDVSENCSATIIDNVGNTIASVNSEVVKEGQNFETMAQSDSQYKSLANVHADMRTGANGFATYTLYGEAKYIAYAPVPNSTEWSVSGGWYLGVYAPISDYMNGITTSMVMTIIVGVVAIMITTVLCVRLGRNIGNSVEACTERIEKLALGDLQSPVPEIKYQDETGRLAEATRTTLGNLNDIIGDIGRILEAISGGDLNVHTAQAEKLYVGDFRQIIIFLRDISHRLSSTMGNIAVASHQVDSGSSQVSAGAQALSQGATEQASSIDELAATINVLSEKIHKISDDADKASAETVGAGESLNDTTRKMGQLVEAMGKIRASSDETKKIIKNIEDIAFQTNILALNAAIEAARAGEAGKGFAVVADEVRNLAAKSAEAAQNTTVMIEDIVDAIANGSDLVNAVESVMSTVVSGAAGVAVINKEISEATDEADKSIQQISTGIGQIANVVQTNSATAEQSAAASEELSAQAATLKELLGAFTLRDKDRV